MRIKKWLISKGQFIISTKNFSLAGKSKKKYWKYVNPVVKIKFGRKLGWVHIHTHFVSVITYYKQYNQKCCKIPAPPPTQYYSKYRHFHFLKSTITVIFMSERALNCLKILYYILICIITTRSKTTWKLGHDNKEEWFLSDILKPHFLILQLWPKNIAVLDRNYNCCPKFK